MSNGTKVYDIKDLAEVLGVTKRTIYNYIKAEQLPAVKIGKRWIVSQAVLDEFIATGTEPNYTKRLEE